MASTLAGIESLISSLRAQSMAQRVVSHNIANAATRGFSRQLPVLSSIAPVSYAGFNTLYGVHQVGAGVRLSSVTRIRNEFLDLQLRFELSSRGEQRAIYDATASMRTIFPELNAVPGSGLMTAVETFFDDWAGLAAATATKAELVDAARNMADLFNGASATLAGIQRTADDGVRETMGMINALLASVAEANRGISAAQAAGGVANDLMDLRDTSLADLSELIRIDVVRLGDGSVLVMAGNGRELVRGSTASTLVATANPHESSFANIGLRDAETQIVRDITAETGGGRIGGLIEARDSLVAGRILEIDKLAHSLVEQVNLLHRAGYASDGVTTGNDFFVGSEAHDIAVSGAVSGNVNLVAASRLNGDGANLEQAETIGLLKGMMMGVSVQSANSVGAGIDPTTAMNLNPFAVAPVSGGAGQLIINGQTIGWDETTDSIEDVVGAINTNVFLANTVRASYDSTTAKLTLVGAGPITVYDQAGNLAEALDLETVVGGLAPANNGLGPLERSINLLAPLQTSDLEYRTLAGGTGVITFQWQAPSGTTNSVSVSWDARYSMDRILNATVVPDGFDGINTALTAAGAPFTVNFDAASQTFFIDYATVPPINAGAPVSPVTVVDSEGNLAEVMNLDSQSRFESFRTGVLGGVQATISAAQAGKDQADAAVDQLQLQWDAVSRVNVDEEKARLLEYLRAYEAAVKALSVLDEALNVLINKMAVTSSGTGSSSVISS